MSRATNDRKSRQKLDGIFVEENKRVCVQVINESDGRVVKACVLTKDPVLQKETIDKLNCSSLVEFAYSGMLGTEDEIKDLIRHSKKRASNEIADNKRSLEEALNK